MNLEKEVNEYFAEPNKNKWLNEKLFFDAIKYFTGTKEVDWGPSLAKDNMTDGEIHRNIIIDKKFYEYHGSWYEKESAKTFIKQLVEGSIKPYNE